MTHLGKKIAATVLVLIILAMLGLGVIIGAVIGFATGLTL